MHRLHHKYNLLSRFSQLSCKTTHLLFRFFSHPRQSSPKLSFLPLQLLLYKTHRKIHYLRGPHSPLFPFPQAMLQDLNEISHNKYYLYDITATPHDFSPNDAGCNSAVMEIAEEFLKCLAARRKRSMFIRGLRAGIECLVR